MHHHQRLSGTRNHTCTGKTLVILHLPSTYFCFCRTKCEIELFAGVAHAISAPIWSLPYPSAVASYITTFRERHVPHSDCEARASWGIGTSVDLARWLCEGLVTPVAEHTPTAILRSLTTEIVVWASEGWILSALPSISLSGLAHLFSRTHDPAYYVA